MEFWGISPWEWTFSCSSWGWLHSIRISIVSTSLGRYRGSSTAHDPHFHWGNCCGRACPWHQSRWKRDLWIQLKLYNLQATVPRQSTCKSCFPQLLLFDNILVVLLYTLKFNAWWKSQRPVDVRMYNVQIDLDVHHKEETCGMNAFDMFAHFICELQSTAYKQEVCSPRMYCRHNSFSWNLSMHLRRILPMQYRIYIYNMIIIVHNNNLRIYIYVYMILYDIIYVLYINI